MSNNQSHLNQAFMKVFQFPTITNPFLGSMNTIMVSALGFPLFPTQVTLHVIFGFSGSMVLERNIVISGTDLDAWGTDDMVVVNYCATQFGIDPSSLTEYNPE